MSKMDNLRAMREAKYAAAQKRTAAGPAKAATRAPVAPPAAAKPVAKSEADDVFGTDSAAEDALCGHRNMSGRTCTREQGHSAKSHRYS